MGQESLCTNLHEVPTLGEGACPLQLIKLAVGSGRGLASLRSGQGLIAPAATSPDRADRCSGPAIESPWRRCRSRNRPEQLGSRPPSLRGRLQLILEFWFCCFNQDRIVN